MNKKFEMECETAELGMGNDLNGRLSVVGFAPEVLDEWSVDYYFFE
jgi:hypothetical protein